MPSGNGSSARSASRRIDAATKVVPHRGTRDVGIIVFGDVLLLDAIGPAEVFGRANHLLRHPDQPDRYRLTALSTFGGEVTTSSGLCLKSAALPAPDISAFDTLLVAGGPGVLNARHDLQLRNWLLAVEPRVRRIGSVCTGAYVLAEAGLFAGRRAASHWGHLERLTELYPDVQWQHDVLYAREGRLFSSAGATAGIDLALSLVDEDFGRDLALAIARELVVFRVRSGGQAQQSAALQAYAGASERLRQATDYILAHLGDPLTVGQVAEHVCISTRQLTRIFQDALSITPNHYIDAARVDLARELLSGTGLPFEKIALRCGFSGRKQMQRVFERVLAAPPASFRPPPAA